MLMKADSKTINSPLIFVPPGCLKHVEHAHHADQQVINILIDANYHKNIHHADQCTSISENMTFKSGQCALMAVVAMFKSNQYR